MKLEEVKIPLPWVITIVGFVASASVATYEFITVEDRSIERDERQMQKIDRVEKKLDKLIDLYNSQH